VADVNPEPLIDIPVGAGGSTHSSAVTVPVAVFPWPSVTV
jgi:hypothetical protein